MFGTCDRSASWSDPDACTHSLRPRTSMAMLTPVLAMRSIFAHGTGLDSIQRLRRCTESVAVGGPTISSHAAPAHTHTPRNYSTSNNLPDHGLPTRTRSKLIDPARYGGTWSCRRCCSGMYLQLLVAQCGRSVERRADHIVRLQVVRPFNPQQ